MSDDREDRLDAIIADYLQKCDDGAPVPADQLVEQHPEFREELRAFLLDHFQMQGLAAPLAVPVMSGQPVASKLRYFGDYELLEEIARGGMGIVYRARQTALNRVVAVKMILAGRLASTEDERRFQIEAEAAASLKHPNIVAVHEVGKYDGQHYFSMQFIAGKNLSQLTRDHLLSIEKSVNYVGQIAEAVHYAHQQGTLHRDLKPSNVLIDENGRVQITDFGLAMKVEGESDLTKSGQALGTPGYMSPEQAQGQRDAIDARSDVYSCGAILYELLTGRPPFRGNSPVDTLRRLIETDPVSPRILNPAIPRDLETICLKCLQKSPAKRYPSAQHLADDLQRFRNDEPIHARPIGAVSRCWRWCRRKPAIAALSLGLVIAVCTTITSLTLANLQVRDALDDRTAALASAQNQKRISDEAFEAEKRALKAQTEAVAARDNALTRLQWQSYIRGILVAQHEYQTGNIAGANKILDACGPEWYRSFEWQYLKQLCRDRSGPSWPGLIPNAGLTDDGLAVIYADGAYRMIETATGKETVSYPFDRFSRTAAISPDARWLAIQGRPKISGISEVQIVRLADGVSHRVLRLPFKIQQRAIAFSTDGNRIAVLHFEKGTRGKTSNLIKGATRFTVWEVASGKQLRTAHSKEFVHVFQGSSPAAVGLCGELRYLVTRHCLYDTVKNVVVRKFTGDVQCAAFSDDGQRLAVADAHGMIEISELPSGRSLFRWMAPSAHLTTIAFRPDGKQLAIGRRNGVISIWNPNNGRQLYSIQSGANLDQIAFCPKRQQLLTTHHTYRDIGSVHVWAARNPDALVINGATKRPSTWGHAPTFITGTNLIAGISENYHAVIWNSVTGDVVQRFPGKERHHFVTVSRDRKLVATVGSRVFQIWNRSTGRLVHTLKPKKIRYAVKCCFSHDGRYFVGAHFSGVTVWNARTGEPVGQFPNRPRYYHEIGFSKDDRFLYAIADNGEGRIWNVPEWKLRCELQIPKGTQRDAALDPEGRILATADRIHGVNLFDTSTGKRIRSIAIEGGSGSIDFSPDGKRILTTTENDIQIRDSKTGELILTLAGHRSTLSRVRFSQDGRRVASTSDDGTLRIWGVPPVETKASPRRTSQPAIARKP